MFANHLKVVLAQLRRYKLQSVINILGMAVGLAGCMLIAVYVLFEWSYDRQYQHADRIYRVSGNFGARKLATVSALVAPLLQEQYPQIKAAARLYANTPGLITHGETSAYEYGLRFADNALFKVFNFDWVAGDPRTALTEPNTVVLTESIARKYFPGEDPMGKILGLETRQFPMTVVGVIRDLPENTHLQFSLLGSVDLGVTRSGRPVQNVLENWGFNIFHTYLLLEEGANIADIEAGFPDFIKRHVPVSSSTPSGLTAMNVRDIHLFSTMATEYKPTGNPDTLLVLAGIAISVLVIACINFMNLSTARAAQRAREIGMRKVMGAERGKLIVQFLSESVFMTLLACLLAFVLVELFFPVFAALTGKNIALSALDNSGLLPAMLVFVVLAGLLAGSYPAFYLSSFSAGSVLKGEMTRGKSGMLFRNLLVLIQFSVSITLIAATAVVFMQMRFARNADLGFETEQTLIVQGSLAGGLGPQWRELQQTLRQYPAITGVSASGTVPLARLGFGAPVRAEGMNDDRDLYSYPVGPEFLENYGIELLSGQTFTAERVADQYVNPTAANPQTTAAIVLNLMTAQEFGWTAETAIGKDVRILRRDIGKDSFVSARVIGVVANAWLESVREPIKPVYFYMPPDYAPNSSPNYTSLSIRLRGNDIAGTLAYITKVWQQFNPDIEMRTHFLEQDFNTLYASETQQGSLLTYFSGLALALASIGLLGLAAFNAERRTREIGVRKVMGSSVWEIVVLLTSDFSRLVLMSNVIAWPLAYYAMNVWLQNFAYRINLTPLVFIGSGLIALCIAWVTVGGTAAKAANQKPVLALRYE